MESKLSDFGLMETTHEAPSRAARAVVLWGVVSAGLMGCTNGLDQPTLVQTPRILNIISSQPEARPGEDIQVGVIAYAPEDPSGASLRYRWRLCDSLPRVFRAASIPIGTPSDPSASECIELTGQDGPVATLPGQRTAQLAAMIQGISMADPRARFLGDVLSSAGIPFEVEVDVLDADGQVLVTGKKVVAIGTRMQPPLTTNPPAVPFRVAGQLVSMPTSLFDHACVTTGTVTVPTDTNVEVSPLVGADWTERFLVYNYSGQVLEGRENEYYSFYTTGGTLSLETSRPPNRDVTFRTPRESGSVRLWMIVRDGHLGGRGCFVDLQVGSPGS